MTWWLIVLCCIGYCAVGVVVLAGLVKAMVLDADDWAIGFLGLIWPAWVLAGAFVAVGAAISLPARRLVTGRWRVRPR